MCAKCKKTKYNNDTHKKALILIDCREFKMELLFLIGPVKSNIVPKRYDRRSKIFVVLLFG